ncbi:hypothetical protein OQA88_2024 [Cercophora sp. LCS_1]
MMPLQWLLAAVLWPAVATSFVLPEPPRNGSGALTKRTTTAVLNFVERWAAIGDSFTAGIGSGKPMGYITNIDGIETGSDWDCSRCQCSWPMIVDKHLGPGSRDFQHPACSGARSGGIFEQANNLEGNLDVVMLTAGGNDLCLAANKHTIEWARFSAKKDNSLHPWSKARCVEAMRRIMDGCDGEDPAKNPLNHKYGGKHTTHSYTFEIRPVNERKHFTRLDASCRARYVRRYTSYSWFGKGWLGGDFGVALRDRAKGCIGPGGLWRWEFVYLDPLLPENNGREWRAYFRASLGANDRCFNNPHVQAKAGGYSHVAKRDPANERYEEFGCSGGSSGDGGGDW